MLQPFMSIPRVVIICTLLRILQSQPDIQDTLEEFSGQLDKADERIGAIEGLLQSRFEIVFPFPRLYLYLLMNAGMSTVLSYIRPGASIVSEW